MSLEALKKQEIIEDEPTSNVPVGNSEYAEPYEPSALKGVAGLAVAGAGAVALRTPIGRAINRIMAKTTPKNPVSRIKEPVDQVEEVLQIAPTRVERGQAMTKPQISLQEQIRQEAIQKSNELKKIAYNNPLSRGGSTNRIGSSLWDYIARHPIAGARKADEWIRDFKSTGPGSFKTGNPDFKSISQGVKKEELWDSNIAQFDKQGNLIGGFLKVAQDKKIPLTKMDLLYIVEKAPVNNLKTRKYMTDVKIVDEAEDVARTMNNNLDTIRAQITAMPTRSDTQTQRLSSLLENINAVQKSNLKINARMNYKFREVASDDYDRFSASPFKDSVDSYENIITQARNLGLNVSDDVANATNLLKRRDTEIFRKLQLQESQGFRPKYGNHSEYRLKGGDEYFENVVYYPKPLPMGQTLPYDFNRHYSGIPNQVYHVRGSIRKTADNQKIQMIDEIQSDYNQKLRDVNPARDRVENAFGSEIEFFSSNRKLDAIVNEMTNITRKGMKQTNADMKRFRELKSEFDEIKANSMNLANINTRKQTDSIPFLPLFGKQNWGGHALKNTIKDAVDRGIQWVGISPVERLHHLKREKFLGDIEFYGNRFGKAGFKNYKVFSKKKDREILTDPNKEATLPAEMKRLAREYNSEVKTIPVAKSDPDKQFKVVRTNQGKKEFGYGDKKKIDEHIAAFKTEAEAQYYVGRYGDNADIVRMAPNDPDLFYDVYAIKISPDMINKPFKAYNEGGLVVNIFA